MTLTILVLVLGIALFLFGGALLKSGDKKPADGAKFTKHLIKLIAVRILSKYFKTYNRKGYTMFDSTHDIACAHVSPDEVYKDWTKVTVKFTASASDDNDGAQTIALYSYIDPCVAIFLSAFVTVVITIIILMLHYIYGILLGFLYQHQQ